MRIEDYASRKNDDVDVFVYGVGTKITHEYKGKNYTSDDITSYFGDDNDDRIGFIIKKEGVFVKPGELKSKVKNAPIFHAYIIDNLNKEFCFLPPKGKVFDFSNKNAKSSIIDSDGHLIDDIKY